MHPHRRRRSSRCSRASPAVLDTQSASPRPDETAILKRPRAPARADPLAARGQGRDVAGRAVAPPERAAAPAAQLAPRRRGRPALALLRAPAPESRRRGARSLPRPRHAHRVGRAHRRLAPRADQPRLLPLPAGRRVRGGVRRAHAQRAPSPRAAPCASATARSSASRRRRACSSRSDGRRRLAARAGARGRGWPAARARRCAPTRPTTRRRAPPRHRPRGRAPPRRQAPARDHQPDRSGAVRADHAPGRLRRDPRQRRLGQDHRGAAPHRLSRLRRSRASTPSARSSWSSRRRCATTCATCCPRSAWSACASPPSASGRTSSACATSRGCRAEPRADAPAVVQRLMLHPAHGRRARASRRGAPGAAHARSRRSTTGRACARARDLLCALLRGARAGRLPRGGDRAVRRLVPPPQRGALRLARERAGGGGGARARGRRAAAARLAAARRARCAAAAARRCATATSRSTRCRTSRCSRCACWSTAWTSDRCITLAGDTQQHLSTHSGFTSWSELPGRARHRGQLRSRRCASTTARRARSWTSRSSRSARCARTTSRRESPKRGPPVELFRFTDRGACVAFLADALRELARAEPLASVAVLTPSPESSAGFFEGLVARRPAARCAASSTRTSPSRRASR